MSEHETHNGTHKESAGTGRRRRVVALSSEELNGERPTQGITEEHDYEAASTREPPPSWEETPVEEPGLENGDYSGETRREVPVDDPRPPERSTNDPPGGDGDRASPHAGPRGARRTPAGWVGRLGAAVRSRLGLGEAGADSAGLGTRPAAGRQKLSPEELEERLKISLRESAVGHTMRVAVGSPKGGVGKSSTAYSLAGAIGYYTNLRVALVDADPNFGSMRLLVPRPVEASVVELAQNAGELRSLSDLRDYVAQNEKMRLDVVLGPEEAHQMAAMGDLDEAYSRIDSVLSKFYDVVIYDLGLGFRDPAIRHVLSLSNELLFVTDSEVIPNAMLSDAVRYVERLGVDLRRTTLVMNHRLPPAHESAATEQVRSSNANLMRRTTEIPYDPALSQLLNTRSFHVEELSLETRLGMLTTAAVCLEGLRDVARAGGKVID